MPVSFHSHSGQFCKHAQGSLGETVLAAIERGFTIYGLSEHVPRYSPADLYPEEAGLDADTLCATFDAFIAEASILKIRHASKITLLIGLETEYIRPNDLEHLKSLLSKYEDQIDYVVGSVHHVNEVPIDFDKETFSRALNTREASTNDNNINDIMNDSLPALINSYLDAQFSLITSIQPEIIGHFDLCCLYYPRFNFNLHQPLLEKVRRNVKAVVEYGGLFEINTAALRKGWDTPYPSPAIVRMIQECHGKFTLSDDSHAPDRVGFAYDKVPQYLRQMNIDTIYCLRPLSSQQRESDLPYVSPRKKVYSSPIEPAWQVNPFWNSKVKPEETKAST